MDYVGALAKDSISRKVKLADLRHNLDARRLNGVRFRKYDLYLQAVRYLENQVEHTFMRNCPHGISAPAAAGAKSA